MGLFDKVKNVINDAKGVINDAKDQVAQQIAQKQEEEKRRQEEEKRRQEEANRFNPDGKSLQWFGSEDGIKTYNEYITAQNYFFEETIKKEHESKYSEYSFDVFVSVIHKDAKLPSVYFRKFANAIDVQALKYVGPTDMLVNVLSAQAQPFYIDDDGEPQPKDPYFKPEELLSVDKNPALFFVKNFNCFALENDAQGSWEDKFDLWSNILIWLGIFCGTDKEILSENPWVFSKETYFNDLGTVRTLKGFYKKCIELASKEKYKNIFEEKYNECE